jgi:hypothetical protein
MTDWSPPPPRAAPATLPARSSPDRPAQVGEPRVSVDRAPPPMPIASAQVTAPHSGTRKRLVPARAGSRCGRADEARVARRSLTAAIAAANDGGTDAVPGEVSAAQRADFAGRVEIRGGRRLCLECRGRGRPTGGARGRHRRSRAMSGTWRHPGRGRRCCPASAGLPAYSQSSTSSTVGLPLPRRSLARYDRRR